MFFSFDGIDGVGKSTQIDLFCAWLREKGHEVVTCRDPGTTRLGEQLRDILLNHGATPIDPLSEMLIYMASRAQLVQELIAPAIEAGRTVVSDRFVLANIVYQGYGGGVDVENIRQVGNVATSGISPDLTFILDLSVEQAAKRIGVAKDRMESRGTDFFERVRQGFLKEARQHSDRIIVVDASREIQTVQGQIQEAALRILNRDSKSIQ